MLNGVNPRLARQPLQEAELTLGLALRAVESRPFFSHLALFYPAGQFRLQTSLRIAATIYRGGVAMKVWSDGRCTGSLYGGR
jgi:hypothetical protein